MKYFVEINDREYTYFTKNKSFARLLESAKTEEKPKIEAYLKIINDEVLQLKKKLAMKKKLMMVYYKAKDMQCSAASAQISP